MPKATEWDWHAWHKDPKTGVRKYMGFFKTDREALDWKKKQTNPGEYSITNLGPTGMARQQGHTLPNPRDTRPKTSVAALQAEARAEAIRKDREAQKVNAEKRAQHEARIAANDKEMATVRKDAAALIEKHKADEKADLDAGINR